mgnify:CR=1 FL=1
MIHDASNPLDQMKTEGNDFVDIINLYRTRKKIKRIRRRIKRRRREKKRRMKRRRRGIRKKRRKKKTPRQERRRTRRKVRALGCSFSCRCLRLSNRSKSINICA